MRVTLPLRLVPRTPACPGFCIFGHRKSACFDRSCCWGGISPEWRLPVLPDGWGPADRDGATRRERAAERGFERVQMSMAGERVSETPNRSGGGPPIERVQMGCAAGSLDTWEPYQLGSFERVQMTAAFALHVAREPSAHRGSRRHSHGALGHPLAFSAPANERLFLNQLITGERLCHP